VIIRFVSQVKICFPQLTQHAFTNILTKGGSRQAKAQLEAVVVATLSTTL